MASVGSMVLFFAGSGFLVVAALIVGIIGAVRKQMAMIVFGAILLLLGGALGIVGLYEAAETTVDFVENLDSEEIQQDIDEGLNDVGRVAGETFGKVYNGLSTGIDNSMLKVKIYPDFDLEEHGLVIGHSESHHNNSFGDNQVAMYLIADNGFSGKLRLTAFDGSKQEMGRANTDVVIEVGDAQFVEFEFPSRTDLEEDSYCTLSLIEDSNE